MEDGDGDDNDDVHLQIRKNERLCNLLRVKRLKEKPS